MSRIPERKHSNQELSNIRTRSAMQMPGQKIVTAYNKQLAKKPIIILGYLVALFPAIWLLVQFCRDKIVYTMVDVNVMVVSFFVALLIAIYIFFLRSLSRHHASFTCIIAMISIFSLVYVFKNNRYLYQEFMAKIGVEIKVSDPLIPAQGNDTNLDPNGKAPDPEIKPLSEADIEKERIREEARQAFAEQERQAEGMIKEDLLKQKEAEKKKKEEEGN